ncbi:hypothetical protein [Cytobacillus dafuensis]|uniref:Uncharacterized protein n=1 Tax=Cytobacillus dafuensis TaxID=1742359 RepID=A0A5B8Z9E4_CYTDA|nr:hypothetical protein [Cytobacillus dafuensis]QED49752.1 hypothetical protein FSZ17_22120 [Cytobacillus dafuensis]
MKQLFMFAAIMGIVIGTYILYQKQLGAIAFFLLSFYFFSLAYSQLSEKTHDDNEEKENGREI